MCGCASQSTRMTPGFVMRRVMSIVCSLLGSARLKPPGFAKKCVECRMGSEFFTRTRSPGVTAVTWETNRHLALSSTTSREGFLPLVMPSRRITPPCTPPSAPTTRASDGLRSPHTSRFLFTVSGSSFGATPANFSVPVSVPPSLTGTSSYAAAGPEIATMSTTAAASLPSITRVTSLRFGIERVLHGQPHAAAVPEEPQRKEDSERPPHRELPRERCIQPAPGREVSGDRDRRRHRVIDVDGAHPVPLCPLELQIAHRTHGVH